MPDMMSVLNTVVEFPVWFPVAATLAGGIVGVLSLCVSLLVLNCGSKSKRDSRVESSNKSTSKSSLAATPTLELAQTKIAVAKTAVPAAKAAVSAPEAVVGRSGSVLVTKIRTGAPNVAVGSVDPEPVASTPEAIVEEGEPIAPAHKTLSLGEAAKLSKLSRTTIYRWLDSGKLKADKVDDVWRISAESLKGILRKR